DLPLPRRAPSLAISAGVDGSQREAALAYLAVTLSHPRWLVERWLDRFGFESTEAWLRFNNAPAPVTLRANRLRATPDQVIERLASDDVRLLPGRFAPDALIVESGHPLRGRPEGLFVVQDEASQLVAILSEPRPGWRVLDACASPGGKTTALAAALDGTGRLIACDVRDRRIALLRKTLAAAGADPAARGDRHGRTSAHRTARPWSRSVLRRGSRQERTCSTIFVIHALQNAHLERGQVRDAGRRARRHLRPVCRGVDADRVAGT